MEYIQFRLWFISIFFLLPFLGLGQVAREWATIFNGQGNGEDVAWDVAVDNSGNVYVTGQSLGVGTGLDYTTIKYNAAGVQLWSARYNGPGNEEDATRALVIDDAGNVYVTGRSIGIGTNFDFATIKYDKNGNTVWIRRFNNAGSSFDEATAIGLDKEGNVYVAGFGATVKYDNNGLLQWVYRHGVIPRSMMVDKGANVYITGYSFSTSYDYATMKFNPNGSLLWSKTYHPGLAAGVALDDDGNVYVTGLSDGFGTSNDIVTVKYDTDGNEQWVARYNNDLQNGWDEPFAIATDDKGYIYVTGESEGNTSGADYITLKYNTHGVQQWAAKYNGPDNVFDRASSIDVDNKGNVYITGFSSGFGTGHDVATIKYNKKGKEEWVERYNGTSNSNDGAYSLSLDSFGNVYVTGQTAGSGTGLDYITIRYAQLPAGCNKADDKVVICHKGENTVCIDVDKIEVHLNHGDQIGACPVPNTSTLSAKKSQPPLTHSDLPVGFRFSIAPNPASFTTKISYELPVEGNVIIKVFDMLGKEIIALTGADRKAGYYSTEFDVSALMNGVYYCRITVRTKSNVWVKTEKVSIVR